MRCHEGTGESHDDEVAAVISVVDTTKSGGGGVVFNGGPDSMTASPAGGRVLEGTVK